MSDYVDWQPDNSPIKVSVHRRVLSGIEQEGAEDFSGVLLGSASPGKREILVEDFTRLGPGPEYLSLEEWFAGGNRHSLPAVGYFRAGGEQSQITEKDRELFARHFPDALNVFLHFRLRDGKAELAQIPAPPAANPRPPEAARPIGGPTAAEGSLIDERRQARPLGDRGGAERLPFRDREPARSPGGTAPLRPREAQTLAKVGLAEGILSGERRAANPVSEQAPPERLSHPERESDRPPLRDRARAAAPSDPDRLRRRPRYLGQIAAVGAGFLLGVLGYLALRGDKPRTLPSARPPVAANPSPQIPASATPDGLPAPPTVTPAAAARPSPFNADGGASEADRSIDPGRGSTANRAEAQQQIRAALARWRDTLANGDVEGHVNLYASTVSPYFTKSRVSRAQVRDDVRQMLDRYGRMKVYKISDINITPVDANHAVATFRKHWETEGSKFSGEETERVKLTREGTDWLVASERELKVYWVRKK